MPIDALLHLDHHRFDADDRIVDQEAEREDQRAERNPLQPDPRHPHVQSDDRQRQRHR